MAESKHAAAAASYKKEKVQFFLCLFESLKKIMPF
jgi:hypothetical protein